ncbi:MAG: ABC transporter permease, partial [Acidobacteriota bacterium]
MKRITRKAVRKNAAHLAGWLIIAAFIGIALFADFLSPYDYRQQSRSEPSAPASGLNFQDPDGNFHFRPMIYSKILSDPLRLIYVEDRTHAFPLEFLLHGYSYRLLGLIETDRHLFGVRAPANGPGVNLLGTDNLGRDRFARLMHAIRFSLVVCSLGVILACVVGILIGGVSGYSGGFADTVLMGATDAMLSLPTLILILAARAAFPLELPPTRAAILLLLIFALTGWAEM